MSNCCTIEDQACEWVVTLAEPVTTEEWGTFLARFRVPAHFLVFMDYLFTLLFMGAALANRKGPLEDTQET